jgi:predicted transcriptional regulator of viral defense system
MDSEATSHSARALAIVREKGIARARDLRAAGIPLVYLKRLCDEGLLTQLGRGLYQIPDQVGSHVEHNLAEVARLVPKGIICLISALRYHKLTTQLPHAVWLTIAQKARAPKSKAPPLEIVRASDPALTAGVEQIEIEGVAVSIYNPAKTVADCFKFRRRVGTDVAIEALRDGLRQRKFTPSELMEYAAIDRVANVIRPYVEAIT